MTETRAEELPTVIIGARPLTIEDVVALAAGRAQVKLPEGTRFREKIDTNARRFAERLAAGDRVYGVTTGFGESCLNQVSDRLLDELPINLVRFHGCGVGELLGDQESAAVLAVCLATVAGDWSSVRMIVLERMADLINHRILPLIPSQGSVGASGDLTPLSYVAAALLGEREVRWRGQVMNAAAALAEAELEPVTLGPKESLAIMNGTAVMTALNCLAYDRATRLARLASTLTGMVSDVTRGNPAHFDERIFLAKPHPGTKISARWIRDDLEYSPDSMHHGRIQDRYSIRCAPHIIGVVIDALLWMRSWVETEINSANYNPLIDPNTGEALHGGNFYGGHACFVADALKNAVANIADLLDRQLALLCDPSTNNGLPENLVGRTGPDRNAHHGFKAMQIAASSLAAEASKLAMPASVFSRSTECHNQDKVSMGTIAARDCMRVLDLTETVAAICILAACQAVDLRGGDACHCRSLSIRDAVRRLVPFNDYDRRQDTDISQVLELIRNETLPVGDASLL